jgi:phytoene dehydrogenase-like protein
MDPKNLIEDQFFKLHPCLPVNTRIGIVGAGPSGISAAYALAKLGYNNVTVLEKYHTVGGMCESVEIEGKKVQNCMYYLLNLACYVMD